MRNFITVLMIIGALNWGLIGFFGYDLVGSLFGGQMALVSRVVFGIVGLAGIYAISFFFRSDRRTAHS